MVDAIGIVALMAIVVAIAAGILFVPDRLTLRPGLSPDERNAILAKRSEKWQRRWGIFYLTMAVIVLIVNGLNLSHESLRSRLGWSIPAAVVVIFFLLSKNSSNGDPANEDGLDNSED
jgi:hypothetical protein